MKMQVVKLILGISKERGVEAAHICSNKLDGGEVIAWLNKLKLGRGPRPVLFMDNASWHKSQEVKEVLKRKQLEAIFNLPYRPDRNIAIESVNGFLKQNFRKKRLRAIAFGEKFNAKSIVRKSVEDLDREICSTSRASFLEFGDPYPATVNRQS